MRKMKKKYRFLETTDFKKNCKWMSKTVKNQIKVEIVRQQTKPRTKPLPEIIPGGNGFRTAVIGQWLVVFAVDEQYDVVVLFNGFDQLIRPKNLTDEDIEALCEAKKRLNKSVAKYFKKHKKTKKRKR